MALYLFFFEALLSIAFVPWMAILLLGLLGLIYLIIHGTYNRLYFTLFSLMYSVAGSVLIYGSAPLNDGGRT